MLSTENSEFITVPGSPVNEPGLWTGLRGSRRRRRVRLCVNVQNAS